MAPITTTSAIWVPVCTPGVHAEGEDVDAICGGIINFEQECALVMEMAGQRSTHTCGEAVGKCDIEGGEARWLAAGEYTDFTGESTSFQVKFTLYCTENADGTGARSPIATCTSIGTTKGVGSCQSGLGDVDNEDDEGRTAWCEAERVNYPVDVWNQIVFSFKCEDPPMVDPNGG